MGNPGADEMWDDFQRGVEQIYVDREHLTGTRYMSLYTYAKDLTFKPFGRTPRQHVTMYDLYKYVEAFIRDHVSTLSDALNGLMAEDLLRLYSSQWDHFKSSSKVLNHVLPFVDEHWMTKYWPQGTEKVYGTYQLALMAWRDILLSASGSKIIDGVLGLIEDERRGNPVNVNFIRDVVFSYVELGLVDKLEEYQRAFEVRFLQRTEHFYERLERELFEVNRLPDYVKNVEQRMAEEERRVETYLHASTLEPLLDTVWKVLLKNHLDALHAEFKTLLTEDRRADLARRYLLISRSRMAVCDLAVIFEEHVWAQGLLAVEHLCDAACKDPMLYVDTLMQAYRKYNAMVLATFASNEFFVCSFNRACGKFINTNTVALLVKSSRKSFQFFAEYFDTVLKKVFKGPHDLQLDHALDGVVALLKYTDDIDVLQKCFTETLANRLVQLSISEDMEAILIHKLGIACGRQYVSTLKLMLRDVAAGREVNEKFIAHMKSSDKSFASDINIRVLTSGLWPFRQSSQLQLPDELEGIVQRYTTFYSGLHSRRKLQWIHNMSNVELETSCFQEVYTLEASTLQPRAVLHVAATTARHRHGLQQVLQSLLKSELLICREEASKDCVKLRPDTIVSLFEGYNGEKRRVNVNVPLQEELEAEKGVSQKMIDDDRKMLVQATIVRIIKIRKTLQHEELIAEIKSQLQPKFEPPVTLIDECINKLIEMEYLEKDDGQPSAYKYLA